MTNREIAVGILAERGWDSDDDDALGMLVTDIEQALTRANLEGQIAQLEWIRKYDPMRDDIDEKIDRLKAELAKERR